MLDNRLIDLFTGLADDTEAAVKSASLFFEKAGFPLSVWGEVDCATRKPKRLVTNLKPTWLEYYFDQGYIAHDPWFKRVIDQSEPVKFAFDRRHDVFNDMNTETETMLGELRDMGLVTSRFAGTRRHQESVSGYNLWSTQGEADIDRELSDWEDAFNIGAAAADLAMKNTHFEKVADMSGGSTAAVSMGHDNLTGREVEALKFLADGLRNDRIAEKMSISLPTVQFHFQNIRRKLGAKTREQALATALIQGYIQL